MTHLIVLETKTSTWTMFSTRTTITRILLDTTLFATPVTTATIPYIKGTSETIARILRTALQHPCISQTHLFTILQQLLGNVKDRDEPSHRQGAVYKIECCDYQATYNGETGRNLNIYEWLNTNEQLQMVISKITLLSNIYKQTTESTGILPLVRYVQYKLLSTIHSGKLVY